MAQANDPAAAVVAPTAVEPRPVLTLPYLERVAQRIAAGDFEVHPTAVALHGELTAEEVAAELDDAARRFATDNKTSMLGVQPEEVLTAMLTALIAARESGTVVPWLKDMILAINMAPTVARSHVQEYRQLSDASMFREFEITDRTLEPGQDRKGDWVTNCSMNATAVRWAGLILFTMTNERTFLRKVALKTGTLLDPPPKPAAPAPGAPVVVTHAGLLNEAVEMVTPEFKLALARATPVLAKTMKAMDEIYGAAGPDLENAFQIAEAMADYEI